MALKAWGTNKLVQTIFIYHFLANITGSVISSTVLKPQLNDTNNTEEDGVNLTYCGINDCPGVFEEGVLRQPEKELV